MDKLCIVIVTFKRQKLLGVLLKSILAMTQAPWRVVVIDNENSPKTAQIVEEYNQKAKKAWGQKQSNKDPKIDESTEIDIIVYDPQEKNLGGSGGFSEGVRKAYELGAEWFWLMDDDVSVLPDAIERMSPWAKRFDVIQGRRYDYDGGPFYWQNEFLAKMAMHNPFSSEKFNEQGYLEMNNVCFEGGMIRRNVVQKIGLPDPRFFIYWDDAVYGYLASKKCTCVLVNEFVLQRTRDITNWDMPGKRQLNSTSNMNRYYIMRNRGLIAQYLKQNNDYNPLFYGFGTLLTISKELLRLLIVDREHIAKGTQQLFRGWAESRRIKAEKQWNAMPPLK